jgi:hypothetical protein
MARWKHWNRDWKKKYSKNKSESKSSSLIMMDWGEALSKRISSEVLSVWCSNATSISRRLECWLTSTESILISLIMWHSSIEWKGWIRSIKPPLMTLTLNCSSCSQSLIMWSRPKGYWSSSHSKIMTEPRVVISVETNSSECWTNWVSILRTLLFRTDYWTSMRTRMTSRSTMSDSVKM